MAINKDKIIRRLWDLGHFRNPAHPAGVTEDELPILQLHDAPVRIAIASFQEFMASDFDRFSLDEHKRIGHADGEIGPATESLFEMPRCGFPDYLEAGLEEANWPTGCRGKLRFGRDFASLPGMSQEDTDKAFWAAVNNITAAIADIDIVSANHGDISNLQVLAGLKRLSGSTLAWSYLARNNCSDKLHQAYNTRVAWALRKAATVGTHELIHAMGGPHVRDNDATMYPSIHSRSLARYGYLNDTDLSMMRGIGYSLSGADQPSLEDLFYPRDRPKPDPPKPEPPTPQPPGPNEYWFSGDFDLMRGDDSLGKYILTPKPEV